MTVPRISAVGFCAHYSPTGDRAFDFALNLSRENDLQLNVFHFLVDPYDQDRVASDLYSRQDLSELVIKRERELRLYYDDRAGDYLEVGFRLCFDNSWRELHRCLANREFQVLVLAKPEPDAWFCRSPLDTFAERFVCPVVVVGPEEGDPFLLNSSAALQAESLGLHEGLWQPLAEAGVPGN